VADTLAPKLHVPPLALAVADIAGTVIVTVDPGVSPVMTFIAKPPPPPLLAVVPFPLETAWPLPPPPQTRARTAVTPAGIVNVVVVVKN
jgi:hypothetical protein